MLREPDVKVISEEHKMIIDPEGFVSEILNNIGDERDVIRELISNASAKEIGATKLEVRVYESDRGLSFTINDDGCGMNYTKDEHNPGRLDKFLNAAQGRQAGFESDEFGAKGLGTKVLYNADYVEVETWDGGKNFYRVRINEPRRKIYEEKELAVPKVEIIDSRYAEKKGTTIKVFGWAGIPTITKNFKIDRLERYLKYYTVLGYTKSEVRDKPFPEFILQIGAIRKTIPVGFPYIFIDDPESEKTVVFEPIKVEKLTLSEKKITIVLKGGITTETSKYQLTEERGGVWLSVNGIPYFKLPTNKYSRRLNFTDDFVRFVVECDDIRLNLSRSDFGYDESYDAFEHALDDAFSQIKESKKFQKFYQDSRKNKKIETQSKMNEKKNEYSSEDKRYVWYKNKMLLAEPQSEYDTAALLWILEGLNGLPFAHFQTLQYAGYREGIDMLINYQEDKDKEEHLCAYAELERLFSNFIKQKHDSGQMSLAFCWKVDKNKVNIGQIKETKKPYKWMYSISDNTIPVFEISQFPDIFIGTKTERKEKLQIMDKDM